jgi:hypothetical protein
MENQLDCRLHSRRFPHQGWRLDYTDSCPCCMGALKGPARGVPPARLIVALFLIDFLKCLQALLALGVEDHATLFQCFALLTLTGLLIFGN